MRGLTVFILAGGEGRRFGGDKLLALVDGEPGIARVVEAAWRAGAGEVLLATRSMERCRLYLAVSEASGCILDPPGCRGPGAAVLAAAVEAGRRGLRRLLLAPGDAPWLEPSALEALASALASAEAAAPLHGDGFLESLLQAHRGETLAALAEPLLRLRRLRGELRATDPLRLAGSLALVGSRRLCWHSTCFAHVNTRESLRVRGARSPLGEGLLLLGPARPRPLPGPGLCGALRGEERLYRGLGLVQLAAHASRDLAALCAASASRSGGGPPPAPPSARPRP